MRTHRIVAWLVGVGLCGFVAGCGGGSSANQQPTPSTAIGGVQKGGGEPGSSPLSPELAKGRAVFEKLDCGNCHKIHGNAVKGKKGGMAPDLGTVGAAREHTAAWLADHINDPTVHKAGSKMPKYKGKITDEDMKELTTYLASLK